MRGVYRGHKTLKPKLTHHKTLPKFLYPPLLIFQNLNKLTYYLHLPLDIHKKPSDKPTKPLMIKELEERRSKGLCF